MKIYLTRNLEYSYPTLLTFGQRAEMWVENLKDIKPRDPRFVIGFSFNGYGSLATHSARRPNTRDQTVRDFEYAATWDQWGVLIGSLYFLDPDMVVGGPKHPIYSGADDFHYRTADRFKRVFSLDDLRAPRGPGFHGDHRFQFDPGAPGGAFAQRCIKFVDGHPCTATQRHPW